MRVFIMLLVITSCLAGTKRCEKIMIYKQNLNDNDILRNKANDMLNWMQDWKRIVPQLKPTIEEIAAKVIKKVVDKIYKVYPINLLMLS